MANDSNQPRNPNNMQALLRFALQATAQEDTTQPTEMDEERRKWLEQALNGMTSNAVTEMLECLEVLKLGGSSEDAVANQEDALDNLTEYVDNLDNANDFEKVGGFTMLIPCLSSSHSGVRQRSAALVGELTQNNPHCQQAAHKLHLVSALLRMIDTDPDKTVCVKALFALSCLVRENPDAQNDLCEADGFSVLLRALQAGVEKLCVKSAFLLTALCRQQPKFKDTLCNMGFVEQLVALIQTEHEPTHEHLLSALLSLASDHPSSLRECRRPELRLHETLTHRLELLQGQDSSKEEIEFCEALLALCFKTLSVDEALAR